jgi:hypothetical protein
VSRETTARIAWTCPECERTYRIPKSRSRPARCAKCEEKKKRADEDSDIEFAAVPPAAESRSASAMREPASPVAAEHSSATRPAHVVEAQSDGPTREQFDQMIAHLESINRTMTLFRRFLWAIGIVALLNVLLVGVSLIYGMSMLGSLSSLFSGSGAAVGNGAGQNLNLNDRRALNNLPPEVRKNLQAVENYSDALNELLEDER